MKRSKRGLNPYERTILDILKNARRPLSTREIAEYGGMSWLTAKNYLKKLYNKRKNLHTKKKGKIRLWYIK